LLGSAAEFARVNDNGSIGIFNVLQRSLNETAAFQLLNWIAIWNPAEFIETPSWTPTASVDSVLQRNIKRCTIHARLSARDDFHLPSARLVPRRNDIRALDH